MKQAQAAIKNVAKSVAPGGLTEPQQPICSASASKSLACHVLAGSGEMSLGRAKLGWPFDVGGGGGAFICALSIVEDWAGFAAVSVMPFR
jgi:hypothetical protein